MSLLFSLSIFTLPKTNITDSHHKIPARVGRDGPGTHTYTRTHPFQAIFAKFESKREIWSANHRPILVGLLGRRQPKGNRRDSTISRSLSTVVWSETRHHTSWTFLSCAKEYGPRRCHLHPRGLQGPVCLSQCQCHPLGKHWRVLFAWSDGWGVKRVGRDRAGTCHHTAMRKE